MTNGEFDLDRNWAAELARGARRAMRRGDVERALELLDWASLLVPNCCAIQRRRVALLLETGHADAAEADVERQLLDRPDDARLLLLRARCRMKRGELTRASEDLSRVHIIARHRCDALELAAQIASRGGDHARTIELMVRMVLRAPGEDRMLLRLSRALIEARDVGMAQDAERLLSTVQNPPPSLLARCLLVQGRPREAVECLEPHVLMPNDAQFESDADVVFALYLESLEQCGCVERIAQLVQHARPEHAPSASLAMAKILLAQGRFRSAAALALRMLRRPANIDRAAALAVSCVAATLAGRSQLACTLKGRASQSCLPSTQVWVETWRRGFHGRILREQRSVRRGGDPSPSVLRPLVRQALAVLEDRLVEAKSAMCEGIWQIEDDVTVCRAALAMAV